jgi:NAD(P)-dependent dehydrogenase (short-subunit alcohol dehydrogenase family)
MSHLLKRSRPVLITGANKGLGVETARQLAAEGYTIIIGARDRTKVEEAAAMIPIGDTYAHVLELDVTRPDTIEKAVEYIEVQFGKLDVLINNEAVFLDNAPPSRLDARLFRQTFETNVYGAFAVTQSMLPLLRKSSSGRIVNMSSNLGSLAKQSDQDFEFADFVAAAYNCSKTALNALTIQFAKALKQTPIKINAADPGCTAADMNGDDGYRTVQQGASIVVRLATLSDDGPTGAFFDENGEIPW